MANRNARLLAQKIHETVSSGAVSAVVSRRILHPARTTYLTIVAYHLVTKVLADKHIGGERHCKARYWLYSQGAGPLYVWWQGPESHLSFNSDSPNVG
jgi:hypothetical protein